jgi:two-component system, cell cycle response regulator DivK
MTDVARTPETRTAHNPAASVLLVEDNALNREMLTRRLKRKGFTVLEAGDATTALSIARSQPVGVVLMDMSLPEIDGWAATRMLKADEATRAIPVMALTAHAMAQDRDEALAAGCDDFETKPIEFDRLVRKMLQLMKVTSAP